ncbi:1,2-dihydroxy-3-keto-5-methylthiopentene dioxygenase [Pseudomarimonas salicorniae]|uniref:Acireductone dioxygenase n=1 Tax=Pseudomarimonas salicorniae TaxID=2933270 RepID=A0ABT0GM17_9GAMM|nr:cupin [Lysobacter sp. CAU 1642]MCK7595412.1 cupin [Lysobacter sp. CAU 1642]
MSRLRIFSESDSHVPLFASREASAIADQLGAAGVRFEQWPLRPLPEKPSPEQAIEAYAEDIQRLKDEGGYQAVDVVSLHPEHPDREALRKKFLNEHTHSEDEVRFFVAGSGLFTLHIGEKVFEVLCEAGDLISVPHGTRHWFDMGPTPHFVAIRLFTNPAGWVANFTGDDIAERFPRFELGQAA